MISHDSVTFGCAGNFLINEAKFGEERQVSYLPLSHIAGMLDIYMPMGNGSTTCFADSNALKTPLRTNGHDLISFIMVPINVCKFP